MLRHRHGILTLRREDGRIICERVRVADTWVRRMRGALFRRTLPSDQGCVLRPSFSIHTMFMQFPIDVVFLDQDLKVLKISDSVRPFHTASCRGAREVVELRAGECERRGLAVGDRVAWASYQADEPPACPTRTAVMQHPLLGPVVVASRDERFVKLMGFLLDARSVDCPGRHPARSARTLRGGGCACGGRARRRCQRGRRASLAANTARALNPDVPIFLAGEAEVAARAPRRDDDLRQVGRDRDARRRRRRGGRRPGGLVRHVGRDRRHLPALPLAGSTIVDHREGREDPGCDRKLTWRTS